MSKPALRAIFYIGVAVVIAVGGLFMVVSYTLRQLEEDENPRALPPMYHNAQQITQQDHVGYSNRVVTFRTTDSPELVRAYYGEHMRNAGWWPSAIDPSQPDVLIFLYETPEDRDKYSVIVTINATASGVTNVKMQMSASARMGDSNWPVEDN